MNCSSEIWNILEMLVGKTHLLSVPEQKHWNRLGIYSWKIFYWTSRNWNDMHLLTYHTIKMIKHCRT